MHSAYHTKASKCVASPIPRAFHVYCIFPIIVSSVVPGCVFDRRGFCCCSDQNRQQHTCICFAKSDMRVCFLGYQGAAPARLLHILWQPDKYYGLALVRWLIDVGGSGRKVVDARSERVQRQEGERLRRGIHPMLTRYLESKRADTAKLHFLAILFALNPLLGFIKIT